MRIGSPFPLMIYSKPKTHMDADFAFLMVRSTERLDLLAVRSQVSASLLEYRLHALAETSLLGTELELLHYSLGRQSVHIPALHFNLFLPLQQLLLKLTSAVMGLLIASECVLHGFIYSAWLALSLLESSVLLLIFHDHPHKGHQVLIPQDVSVIKRDLQLVKLRIELLSSEKLMTQRIDVC